MNRLRFDCVFYYVTDLDQSVAFYTSILGLSLSSRDVVARLDLDGVLIELVPTDDVRLALVTDDIQAASDLLRSRDVPVAPAHRVENGLLAAFRDPDGNELVLWQYASA